MGTNVPDDRQSEVLQWFDLHIPYWSQDPGRFGLTQERIDELRAAYEEAAAAHTAASQARMAARSATATGRVALARLSGIGRSAVNSIKAHIVSAEDPDLWGDAGLTRPDRRGTLPVPAKPDITGFAFNALGELTIRWKVTHPRGVRGVVYQVSRSLEGGPLTLIDTVGTKSYTDTRLPIGFTTARYRVQPRRGRDEGPGSNIIEVTPGVVMPSAKAASQRAA